MNLPNKLTVVRIFLVPVLVAVLLIESIPNRFLFAMIVFIVAAVTDHVDGAIARKFNQVTTFGKFADPLADKILVISSLVCFVQLDMITSLPVIIIVAREFLVTAIRLIAVGNGEVISANIWGKIKTVSQIFSITCILLIAQYEIKSLFSICEVLVWISALFSVISGLVYLKNNVDVIKNSL